MKDTNQIAKALVDMLFGEKIEQDEDIEKKNIEEE